MKTIFISSTKNNLFITVNNNSDELLYKDSGGFHCKRGSEKRTPKVAEKMLKKLVDYLVVDTSIDYVLKFRNPRYTDKGKMTKQLKLILKNWPSELILREIIDANKIIKTTVRYKARRRV